MYRPDVIVLDFETALTDGTPSTEYYRDDFRAVSCAFAWISSKTGNIVTDYREGEEDILDALQMLDEQTLKLVAHNFQFEYGVLLYRFPGHERMLEYCTMRLTQVADNGGKLAQRYEKASTQTYEEQLLDAVEGDEAETDNYSVGLGLVSACSRWLPVEYQEHKEPFYALIRERTGCKRGQEGQNLNALTAEELQAYNVADAVVTLRLWLRLTEQFKADGYSWQLDHTLYRESAKRISRAKGRGIPVDLQQLSYYRAKVKKEVDTIAEDFRSRFKNEILDIETQAMTTWAGDLKTERGRQGRKDRLATDEEFRQGFQFNIGSNQQLAALFVGKLGMTPKFTTKTGLPSFKSVFLSQWGDGGEILMKRRKRLLVLQQVEALIELAQYDGKWHVDLKACGTTTGRFAGGRM